MVCHFTLHVYGRLLFGFTWKFKTVFSSASESPICKSSVCDSAFAMPKITDTAASTTSVTYISLIDTGFEFKVCFMIESDLFTM